MRGVVALCVLILSALCHIALSATTYALSNVTMIPEDDRTYALTDYIFSLSISATEDGGSAVPLGTGGSFVDKSAEVSVNMPASTRGAATLACSYDGPSGQTLTVDCTRSPGTVTDPLGILRFHNFQQNIAWTPLVLRIHNLRNSKSADSSNPTLSIQMSVNGASSYNDEGNFPNIVPGELTNIGFTPSEIVAGFDANFLIRFQPRFALEDGERIVFTFPTETKPVAENPVHKLIQAENCAFYDWRDPVLPLCNLSPDPDISSTFTCTFVDGTDTTDPSVSCLYRPTNDAQLGFSTTAPTYVIITGLTLPPYAIESSANRMIRVYAANRVLRDEGMGSFMVSVLAPCGPGYASERYDGNCVACPEGTFSEHANSLECSPCPSGKINTLTGMSACIDCGVGTFSRNTTFCEECEPGKYQANTGAAECLPCREGTVTNTTGSDICSPCPQDWFVSERGKTECFKCAEGTATPQEGAASCTYCAPGYRKEGAACVKCEPGQFLQRRTQDNTCSLCNTGEYAKTAGASACSKCATGYFAGERGSPECGPCPAGRYSFREGSVECNVCGSGRYATQALAATGCRDCNNGQYAPEGSTSCLSCSPGRFSVIIPGAPNGPAECTPCEIGSYTASNGESVCTPCQPGHYAGEVGSTSCRRCEVGRYGEATRMGSCVACPINTFTNVTGTVRCEACPEGLSAPDEGSDRCILIPPGCSRGEYGSLVNGEYDCHPCEKGKYNNEFAQAECKNCPSGRFNNNEGRTICEACPVGQHQTKTGQTACVDCPLGRYTDITGFAVCTPCPVGHTTRNRGQTQCDQCNSGTIAPFEGLEKCEKCVHSKYNARSGASACSSCPAQTVTRDDGAVSVTECKVVKCTDLRTPSSGISRVVTDGIFGPNRVGSVAVYSCLAGFVLIGEPTRTCVSDGTPDGWWTGQEPTCGSTSATNAPLARLSWQVQPEPSARLSNGNQFPNAPTVAVVDASGRIITDGRADNVQVTVSVVIPPTATLPSSLVGVNRVLGTIRRKPIAGMVVLDDLTIRNKGQLRFVASAPGFPDIESNNFIIANGPATRLVFTSVPLRTSSGMPLRTSVVVTVTDEWGFPVGVTATGRPPRVTLTVPDTTMMLNGRQGNELSVDCVDGVATFSNIVVSLAELSTTSSHTFYFLAEGSDLVSAQSPDITLYGSESNNVVERERDTARAAVIDFTIAGLSHIIQAYEGFTTFYREQLHLDICAALGLSPTGCQRVQIVGFGAGNSAFEPKSESFALLSSDLRDSNDASLISSGPLQLPLAEVRYLVDPYLRELTSVAGSNAPFPATTRPENYRAAPDVEALDATSMATALAEIEAADAIAAQAAAAADTPSLGFGTFSAAAATDDSTAVPAARAAYAAAAARPDSPMQTLATVDHFSARVQINPPTRPSAGSGSIDTISTRSVNTLPAKELALMLAQQFANRRSALRLGAVTSHVDPDSLKIDTSGRNISPLQDSTTTVEDNSEPWYKSNGFIIGISAGCGALLLIIIFFCVYRCLSNRPKERQEVDFTPARQAQTLRHPAEVTVDIYSKTPQRTGGSQKNNAGVGRSQKRARRIQPMNF